MKKILLSTLVMLSVAVLARAEDNTDEQTVTTESQNDTASEDDGSAMIPEANEISSEMDAMFFNPPSHHRPPHRDHRPPPPGYRPHPPHHRPNPPPYYPAPPNRRPYPPPHHRPSPPPAYPRTDYVHCGSQGYRYNECYVGGYLRNAGVSQQHSHSRCEYGYSWGIYNDRIWVDHGCEATFWIQTGR